MDSKLRDYINKYARDVLGKIPLDFDDEPVTIKDTFHAYQNKYLNYQVVVCEEILKARPNDSKVTKWKNDYISKLQNLRARFPIPASNLADLINSINNAFFKVESFINGSLNGYDYFGFFDTFIILFEEAKKPKNWSIENCDLIAYYYILIQQIVHDVYNSGYAVDGVLASPQFNDDMHELQSLSDNFLDAFYEFIPKDEIGEFNNQRNSIKDIWKPQRPEPSVFESAIAPTFREESKPEILQILQPYFSPEDGVLLKDLFERKKINRPILFKGKAGTLCDLIKQLYLGQFLFVEVQQDLEPWIRENFLYADNGQPTELQISYISKFISEKRRAAKVNRLIEVENVQGKNIIVELKKVSRKKY